MCARYSNFLYDLSPVNFLVLVRVKLHDFSSKMYSFYFKF